MQEKVLHIKGLSGRKDLEGEVVISGAKNAILPVMASSILFKGVVVAENVPEIEDVSRMGELLSDLGIEVSHPKRNIYTFSPQKISSDIFTEIAKRLRASVILTGPLLARLGRVSFPHPGGCVIGERPIDIFLDGFKKMGAMVSHENDKYIISSKGKLRGAELFLRSPSVTATETFMMAAVLASGETIIKNAATEPEIESLGEFLVSSGAQIKGLGTSTITIKGGSLLSAKKKYITLPDRIEAGSFLILGALCANNLIIKNANHLHLESLIFELKQSGVPIETTKNSISIKNNGKIKNSSFKTFSFKTHEYPGIPTDLQAPLSVFQTQASGESLVFETIFENRLSYAEDLIAMGADIRMLDAHRMIIKGASSLKGRDLYGPDLRAGLAFVIASLVAKGESRIHNVYYIDRGYETLEKKLQNIGVVVDRM